MPMRPAASSSPLPMDLDLDHRTSSPPPPQLRLPSSVVYLRRRRTPRSPRQAPIPAAVVPPPAAPPPPAPSSAPRRNQIPAAAPAADDGAAADADDNNLMLLAYIAVSQADAEAEASPPLAPPRRCPHPPPFPAPLPGLAVNHNHHPNPSSSLSTMGHGGDAAAKATAVNDCKKAAACPQLFHRGNAGSSSEADHSGGGGVASPAAAAAECFATPMQLGDDDDEELELGEIPPEKPAPGCNADPHAAHEFLLACKEEETAAKGKTDKTIAAAGELAATGSSTPRRAPAVVGRDGKGKAAAATETETSPAEKKRMREVFVGGLSKDATEGDVWAVFSAAGEITEVRLKKCYCFVAYRDAAMASKAVAELANVKICGKPIRTLAVSEGNEKTNRIAQRDPVEDYNRIYEPSPTLAVHSSYIARWDHQINNTYAIPASSYIVPPLVAMPGYYYPTMYHIGNNIYLPAPDLNNGLAGPSGRSQMGQSGSSRPAGPPNRSRN